MSGKDRVKLFTVWVVMSGLHRQQVRRKEFLCVCIYTGSIKKKLVGTTETD